MSGSVSWLGLLLLLLLCFQDNEVSGTAIVHFRGSALDGTAQDLGSEQTQRKRTGVVDALLWSSY
jgi:hypothetical protein